MKFILDFETGLKATLTVPDERPANAREWRPEIYWSRDLLTKEELAVVLPQYTEWMIVAHRHIADRWNHQLGYWLDDRGWLFIPGKEPCPMSRALLIVWLGNNV